MKLGELNAWSHVIDRVGILGGSFDPPHKAHVALARSALSQLLLDVLHVVPTGAAWHKARMLSLAKDRVAMARLAFLESSPVERSSDKIVVDEREILRSGPSFTIDTVKEIEQLYPGATIYLIIGQDQAQAFSSWREHALLVQKTQVVIAARDAGLQATSPAGLSPQKPAVLGDAIYLNCPLMPISATEVRASIDQGLDVSQLVPELVLHYIQQQGLYSNNS